MEGTGDVDRQVERSKLVRANPMGSARAGEQPADRRVVREQRGFQATHTP
jgi:hypothetical protein